MVPADASIQHRGVDDGKAESGSPCFNGFASLAVGEKKNSRWLVGAMLLLTEGSALGMTHRLPCTLSRHEVELGLLGSARSRSAAGGALAHIGARGLLGGLLVPGCSSALGALGGKG